MVSILLSGFRRPDLAGVLLLAAAAGPLATAARAQGEEDRALDARPEDRLRAERDEVAALIADIDDGDTYIGDSRLGLSGPDHSMLSLPIPVDREDLVNMMTLAVLDLGGLPDDDQIPRFVREMRASTLEARQRLGLLLQQYDEAIRRRTGETPPIDTSDQDALARQAVTMTDEECIREFGRPCDRTERKFDPNDPASVQAYLSTTWRVQVTSAGAPLSGSFRVEYVHCEPPDEFIAAVACDFNGVFNPDGGGSVRVEPGMYVGGEVRLTFRFPNRLVSLEGQLPPTTGDMTGASIHRAAGRADGGVGDVEGRWRIFR